MTLQQERGARRYQAPTLSEMFTLYSSNARRALVVVLLMFSMGSWARSIPSSSVGDDFDEVRDNDFVADERYERLHQEGHIRKLMQGM